MSHKPHLYAENLDPQVDAIIANLQSWLLEAEFTIYVQGRAESPRQHGVYEGEDRFERLEPILDKFGLNTQVRSW